MWYHLYFVVEEHPALRHCQKISYADKRENNESILHIFLNCGEVIFLMYSSVKA